MAEISSTVKPIAAPNFTPGTHAQRRPAVAPTAHYVLDNLLHNSALIRSLPNLHREGHYLRAQCPQCKGSTRSFYAGPKTSYRVFRCHSCEHYTYTDTLIGLAWTVAPAPAVKPWMESAATSPGQILAIRDVYGLLATYAQTRLPESTHAIEALAKRGLTLAMAQDARIGYIDGPAYQNWFMTVLTSAQRTIAVGWAGLPDGSKARMTGHAAMFAGGHKGKLLFPYYNPLGDVVDVRTRSISAQDTITGKQVRYTSPKGANLARGVDAPYGVATIGTPLRIVLTEGEFKRIVPMAHGSLPVIALRGTGDWTPAYLQHFRNRVVILGFDNDDQRQTNGLTAGQMATVNHGRTLEAHSIDVMVLDPAQLGDHKGIDDFVVAHGADALNHLLQPAHLLTLAEFEAKLIKLGGDLSRFVNPKADIGTIRQWAPVEQIDTFAHAEQATVTVDEAVDQIRASVSSHLRNYKRGNDQLLITAPAGVGKTQTAIEEATRLAQNKDQTIAVFLPTHATIEEKIEDGTLVDFQHIYGHNADNCQQSESAIALAKYGYSPGAIICPTCPALRWCQAHGYKSQFKYKANRAYVHAHLHTDYPAGEDMVIVDELTHKSFVGLMNIWPGDVINALSKATIGEAQRALLTAIISMFSTPNLSNLAGAIFYEVLERFYPDLRNVDAWGDGSLVQSALNEVAFEFSAQVRRTIYEAEELPQQFGEKLFAILSDDVRRLNAGQMPTGRIRMAVGKTRRIELSYAKGALPAWYGQRPTIVMNATADPDIMQHLIGPVKVVAPVVAPAAGATIIQDLTMNNAKSSLVGNSPEADKRRTIWLGNIRRHIEAHPGGEADTVIITTKVLLEQVHAEFPAARVAYYHALEGRNDLQAGLTILANTPPINLDAIKREAAALYPGIDATLTRTSVAFDEANASGEHIAVEQIDGADPRLQALIWQHRDAAVIQAAHRSRILRNPDRTIVIMFSRPIPGLRPTQIIRDYAAVSAGRAEQRQAILSSLIEAGGALIDDVGGFTVESLAGLSESSVNTVRKYWQDITTALSLHWLDLPVLQTLNHGTARARTLRVALPREAMDKCKMHVDHERYKNRFITFVIYVQPLLPHGWTIDESILHDMMNMGPAAPEPVKEAPIAVPLAHRWRFVGQASLLIGDLVLSDRSEDTDKRRTAKTLRGYLDGHHHDHRLAYLAAFEIGVQACRGIQWGALAKTVNT